MNILPKKSWHVRTKANIERVRKDEENAANEEKERLRKIALAEQEARTNLLRDKARNRHRHVAGPEEQETSVVAATVHEHVNFFKHLEDGQKQTTGTNKEYEAEKKAEQEKQEKAIGLLIYLGQSSVEAQTTKPWYFKPPEKKLGDKLETDTKDKSREEADRKRKHTLDPMRTMIQYVDVKKKCDDRKHGVKHSEKDRKHKHKSKDKHREKVDRGKEEKSGTSVTKTMAQLRAERLNREQEERHKTEQLMAKIRGDKTENKRETVTDEREMRYHSQFNPDFVRQKKRRQDQHPW